MNPIRKYLAGTSLAGADTTTTTAAADTNPTAATTDTGPGANQAPRPDQGQAPDWSKGGHQANGKTEAILTGANAARYVFPNALPGTGASPATTPLAGTGSRPPAWRKSCAGCCAMPVCRQAGPRRTGYARASSPRPPRMAHRCRRR